jgi:hypothetical protein
MIVDMLAADPTTPGETLSLALRTRMSQRTRLRIVTHPNLRADAPTDGLAVESWEPVLLAFRSPALTPVARAHLVDAAARGKALFSLHMLLPSVALTTAEVERGVLVHEHGAVRSIVPTDSFVASTVVGHPCTPDALARASARAMVADEPMGVRECGYSIAVAAQRHGWTLDDVVDRSTLRPGAVADLLAQVAEAGEGAGWSPAALVADDLRSQPRWSKSPYPRFLAAALYLTGDRRFVDDALDWLAADPDAEKADTHHQATRRGGLATAVALDETLDLDRRVEAVVAGQHGQAVVDLARTCGPEMAERLVGRVTGRAIVQALATNPAVDVAAHHTWIFPRTDRAARVAVAARPRLSPELRARYLASAAGAPPGVEPQTRDEISVVADLVDHVTSQRPERTLAMPVVEVAAPGRSLYGLEPLASLHAALGAQAHPLWPLSPEHLVAATAFRPDGTAPETFGELLDEIGRVAADPSLVRPDEPPRPPAEPEPAVIDEAWLATLTDDTAWSGHAGDLADVSGFRRLAIGPLADRGTRPVLDVDHDETAWFYRKERSVSDAVLRTGSTTREEHFWFLNDRAVLVTYEKRAVVHRGRVVRLWPRSTATEGDLEMLVPPSPRHPYLSTYVDDTLVESTRTRSLAGALRTALETSTRTGRPVVLGTETERQDLY